MEVVGVGNYRVQYHPDHSIMCTKNFHFQLPQQVCVIAKTCAAVRMAQAVMNMQLAEVMLQPRQEGEQMAQQDGSRGEEVVDSGPMLHQEGSRVVESGLELATTNSDDESESGSVSDAASAVEPAITDSDGDSESGSESDDADAESAVIGQQYGTQGPR